MNVAVRTITPTDAEAMLANNEANRSIRPRYVQSLARQMTEGLWRMAGDPIRFAADGTLLDGQHRLSAIIESRTAQDFVIITGLTSSAQVSMDSGIKRSFADVLHMKGETNCNVLAAVIRLVALHDRGVGYAELVRGAPHVGYSELLETYEKHADLGVAASFGQRLSTDYRIGGRIGGFCWHEFGKLSVEDRDDFFDRLKNKDFTSHHDPLSVLYVTMLENASSVRRLPDVHKFALLVKTWNFYREGAEVKLLRWRRGGAKPEAFPTPY